MCIKNSQDREKLQMNRIMVELAIRITAMQFDCMALRGQYVPVFPFFLGGGGAGVYKFSVIWDADSVFWLKIKEVCDLTLCWWVLAALETSVSNESTLRYTPEGLNFLNLLRRKLIGCSRRSIPNNASSTHVRQHERRRNQLQMSAYEWFPIFKLEYICLSRAQNCLKS